MAIGVLIMGPSGSGKTYSIKGFNADEVGVISVEKGRLPFKSDIKVMKVPKLEDTNQDLNSYATIHRAKYSWIMSVIKQAKAKSIIIDDSQYLLVNELFDRAGEKGYEKFTEMAKNFRDLVHFINELEDEEKVVYFLHHSETGSDGREKVKTTGKMLEEKLVVEGIFDIVLFCQDRKFITQANGQSTAKSPEGMFEIEMDNNLKLVDTKIREYYNIGTSKGGKEDAKAK